MCSSDLGKGQDVHFYVIAGLHGSDLLVKPDDEPTRLFAGLFTRTSRNPSFILVTSITSTYYASRRCIMPSKILASRPTSSMQASPASLRVAGLGPACTNQGQWVIIILVYLAGIVGEREREREREREILYECCTRA